VLSIQATQTEDTKRVFKVRVGLDQNDSERMKMSGRFVKGPWRYEQIDGASHWIPLDASDRLNQLLIEWLR
jgi:pimeloyl-ACP methyl ester carboxylesterase